MLVLGWGLLVLFFTAVQPAPAVAAPVEPSPAALSAPLEQEARRIEAMLIAPCCWMQPVSEHASQASDDVKRQIRVWLGQGMTRQQVLDAFVGQYGARILAEPPNRGFSRFLYLTPWLVLGVSAIGLVGLVTRMTVGRRASPDVAACAAPAQGPDPAGPGYEQQLDDELREMD